MVFAEAMAMGAPVVGPCMAPVTEVVPEECGVLVEPENVEALVQALGGLVADEGLRSRIAEKGKEHALVTWCGQKAAERVMDVYRELLIHKRVAN
jgi:glycosyltransferase involved in cell wall biosynthesis